MTAVAPPAAVPMVDRDAQPRSDLPEFAVVIPCHCEQETLERLFERVSAALDKLPGRSEIVIVDDGSTDATASRAAELAVGVPHDVTVVRLARNFGQHPAVFAGLAVTRATRVVVTMDGDLQYPPERIPDMVRLVSPSCPVVSTVRQQGGRQVGRSLATRIIASWLGRRTGRPLLDYGSMFRAYDRQVVDAMLTLRERFRYVPAVAPSLGFAVHEIPVELEPRAAGRSRYRFASLANLLLDLVTSYSVSPLRLLAALGAASSFAGFLAAGVFFVYRIAVGGGASGTVGAFAMLFFLSSVQLLLLALLGEYVGRILVEVKDRPYFVVAETRGPTQLPNNHAHPAPDAYKTQIGAEHASD